MMKLQERLKLKSEEGLSLIEMVVAIVVFAIVALSAYPIFLHSIQAVSTNNVTTAAAVTVNDILEDIKNNPSCAAVAKIAGSKDYKDGRGLEYSVSVKPNYTPKAKCEQGSMISLEVKAVRHSATKTKVLLEQKVQVLVPPRNGVIELG